MGLRCEDAGELRDDSEWPSHGSETMATCKGVKGTERKGTHAHARLERRATVWRLGLLYVCWARVKANAKREKWTSTDLDGRNERPYGALVCRQTVRREMAHNRKETGETGMQMPLDWARPKGVYTRVQDKIRTSNLRTRPAEGKE